MHACSSAAIAPTPTPTPPRPSHLPPNRLAQIAVLAAHPDQMVVVMASVTWCRPCRAFQPKYEASGAAAWVHGLGCAGRTQRGCSCLRPVWGREGAEHALPWARAQAKQRRGRGAHPRRGAARGGSRPTAPCPHLPGPPGCPVLQKTAAHYKDAIFLKFYGGWAMQLCLQQLPQPWGCELDLSCQRHAKSGSKSKWSHPSLCSSPPGNSNEGTKALFKDRLKCRTTPSFFFLRGGEREGLCSRGRPGLCLALLRFQPIMGGPLLVCAHTDAQRPRAAPERRTCSAAATQPCCR